MMSIGPDEEIERAGVLFEILAKKPRKLTFEAFLDQLQDDRKWRDWAITDRMLSRCKWMGR